MKDKMTNQTIVDIRQKEDTVYNPLEIKENFTQTQIEKTAEMLGIEKNILIRLSCHTSRFCRWWQKAACQKRTS